MSGGVAVGICFGVAWAVVIADDVRRARVWRKEFDRTIGERRELEAKLSRPRRTTPGKP